VVDGSILAEINILGAKLSRSALQEFYLGTVNAVDTPFARLAPT
jgi:hypothetical protein